MKNTFYFLGFLLYSTLCFGQAQALTVPELIEKSQAHKQKTGDILGAIKLLEDAPSDLQDAPDIICTLARYYFWVGQLDRATHKLKRYLANSPQDLRAQLLLVDIYESQDLYESSERLLRSIRPNGPLKSEVRYRLAYSIHKNGKHLEACDSLASILLTDQNHHKSAVLYTDINPKIYSNMILIGYQSLGKSLPDPAVNMYSLTIGHKLKETFVLGGLNTIASHDRLNYQSYMEVYVPIKDNVYVYSNISIGHSDLFAKLKFSSAAYWEINPKYRASILMTAMRFVEGDIYVITPTIEREIKSLAIMMNANYNKSFIGSELSYGIRVRKHFKHLVDFIGISYGSLSDTELINNENRNRVIGNYLMLETKLNISQSIALGSSYRTNISSTNTSRSIFNLNIKKLF